MNLDFVFSIAILIMSVVIHEVSHGYAAYFQGDKTAEYQGRLTLNPLMHLDIWGSLLVPIISYSLGGFIIGWAKPVPYNPYNLRNQRWGEAIVAVAGPASNIVMATIFGLLIRFTGVALPESFIQIAATAVFINILLAIFNLVPVPPLDGSKGGTGTRLNMAKSMFKKTAVAAICIKDSGRATPVNLISRPKMVAMTMFEAGPATATMASPHL